jgi:hypothetical protein
LAKDFSLFGYGLIDSVIFNKRKDHPFSFGWNTIFNPGLIFFHAIDTRTDEFPNTHIRLVHLFSGHFAGIPDLLAKIKIVFN